MSETRKIAAILVTDIVGFSRLAGADEDQILARLRTLRSDLIDPTISVHHGRIVKRTGDGIIAEFRSAVEAVHCAIEVQSGLVERNAGLPPERRIEFRIGIHLGDVVEESDGDLMGDGVNIAARLEGIAEPGGVCLSEDAYRLVSEKLKHEFVELGKKALKNIARPIGVYALKSRIVAPAHPAFSPNPPGPPSLSFVVLPFANLSNDPDQDYFVDSVTESLTTDLSRIIGSFVIGRSTAFTYKGKNVDLKQIGRELNVRYILEGSIQRSGNRMRVNVQLIDAESGNHLWADRFEKPLADLFDMHDEIVGRLAHALTARLIVAEARRTERAPDPDSMDLSHQGWACLFKGSAPHNLATARPLFERALALDSANVPALVGVAFVDMNAALRYPDDQTARFAAAEEALTRALSLAPDGAAAHYSLGVVQLYTNRAAQGIRECEWALELDPNLVEAHAAIGFVKILLGRAEDTEAHIRQALRLSPRDASVSDWYRAAGLAKLYLSEEEEAIARLRSSVETNPNIPLTHFLLAAALVRLGRLPEARSEAQAGLAIDPTFTISRFRAGALSDNPRYLAQRECVIEDFRKTGLPEK